MANNFYNNTQFPELYNNTSPNGCRLCNKVFTNTQALLTHIESHMAQEEVSIRRLYSSPQHVNRMQMGSHQFPAQPVMGGDGRVFLPQPQSQPMGLSQPIRRNPFFNNANRIGSSSIPIRQMQHPSQVFPYVGRINDDGSKAYISKLEKPIKKIDVIDLVHIDDDNKSEVGAVLDLDLKL